MLDVGSIRLLYCLYTVRERWLCRNKNVACASLSFRHIDVTQFSSDRLAYIIVACSRLRQSNVDKSAWKAVVACWALIHCQLAVFTVFCDVCLSIRHELVQLQFKISCFQLNWPLELFILRFHLILLNTTMETVCYKVEKVIIFKNINTYVV